MKWNGRSRKLHLHSERLKARLMWTFKIIRKINFMRPNQPLLERIVSFQQKIGPKLVQWASI